MKKITLIVAGIAALSGVIADTGYFAQVPEFSTPTLGIAIVIGGLGFALLRKR